MLNYDFQINVNERTTEPKPTQTVAFEKSLTTKSVKMLFYNSQVTDPDHDRLKKIAQQSSVPIVGSPRLSHPDQKSYVDLDAPRIDQVESCLATKVPLNSTPSARHALKITDLSLTLARE